MTGGIFLMAHITDSLKQLTKFAKRKKTNQLVLMEAIIEFLIFNEDKITITDGRLIYKEK